MSGIDAVSPVYLHIVAGAGGEGIEVNRMRCTWHVYYPVHVKAYTLLKL